MQVSCTGDAPLTGIIDHRVTAYNRLAVLQQQQLEATQDLLLLRGDQLKLRRQQLTALQALLSCYASMHIAAHGPVQVCLCLCFTQTMLFPVILAALALTMLLDALYFAHRPRHE